MTWQEAKKIIALIWIFVFLWRWVFHLVAFWPLLQDDEFDQAILRAESVWIDAQNIQDSPFGFITRSDAAKRYVSLARHTGMTLYSDDICKFNDIDHLEWDDFDLVILSCGYRFFWWSKWWFVPDGYLTKSWSIVALMKWFYPTRDRWETEPYREPFVTQAYQIWITKRESNEYMMYLVTKYELLLQLWRASKVRNE